MRCVRWLCCMRCLDQGKVMRYARAWCLHPRAPHIPQRPSHPHTPHTIATLAPSAGLQRGWGRRAAALVDEPHRAALPALPPPAPHLVRAVQGRAGCRGWAGGGCWARGDCWEWKGGGARLVCCAVCLLSCWRRGAAGPPSQLSHLELLLHPTTGLARCTPPSTPCALGLTASCPHLSHPPQTGSSLPLHHAGLARCTPPPTSSSSSRPTRTSQTQSPVSE